MNGPDDDLHSAFQRWRSQEAAAASPFRGIPARQPARRLPLLLVPLTLGAAAVLFVLVMFSPPRPSNRSLTEILPRPLLAPSRGEDSDFLAGSAPRKRPLTSDFLLPPDRTPVPSLF